MKTMQDLTASALQSLSSPSKAPLPLVDSKPVRLFCTACNAEWERPAKLGEWVGGRYSTVCAACVTLRRIERFQGVCPPLYQHTDAARLPAVQLAAALAWQYSPRGLILLGETGKGKTRVAWQLLRRVLVEDKEERGFLWFDSIGFGHEISKRYRAETAEAWLEKVAAVPLLFFDDLGKLKLTERAEVELFGVIERRCAAELPVIVTTNDTGDSLAARMTDNRGPAMIRRLREFCEPIQF